MIRIAILICLGCLISSQLSAQTNDTKYLSEGYPVIHWEQQTYALGKVKKGETRDLVYNFTNVGTEDLIIELVTACKCTSFDWPRKPIPPGGNGYITATYDSSTQKLGSITKTIDVIANTSPIVVEMFFNVEVIE